MLLLFIFCVAADVVAATNTAEDLIGTWYNLAYFPAWDNNTMDEFSCDPHTLSRSSTLFDCDGKVTESVNYSFLGRSFVAPVTFVERSKDASPKLINVLNCENVTISPAVYQVLDKNHFLSFLGVQLIESYPLTRLFGRNIPSHDDLIAYVKTIHDLKFKKGKIVCVNR